LRDKIEKIGYFIVFEGPDGSGKTTQAQILHHKLTLHGYSSIVTEEPGATKEGKIIRDTILNPELRICPKTELFLFLADRADHVNKVIAPALKEGKIVICSRYFYSTLVYQGLVREVASLDFLYNLNLFATRKIIPDVVFYIDIKAKHGLSKAKGTTARISNYPDGDRIESEGIQFHQSVRKGYKLIASRFKDRFIIIDANNKSKDEIGAIIYSHLKRRLFND